MRLRCLWQPVEVRGRDDLLRAGGKRGEQGGAAVEIEFAKDVVEQQDRRRGEVALQQAARRPASAPAPASAAGLRWRMRRIGRSRQSGMSSRCGPTLVCRRRASSLRAAASVAGKSSPAPGTYSSCSFSRAPLIARCASLRLGLQFLDQLAPAPRVTRCPRLSSGSSKAAISRQRGDADLSSRLRDRSARS